MKKPFIALIFIFLLTMTNTISIIGAEGTSPTKEDSSIKGSCINASVTELKYPMQKLWIEDAWWTRSYIVSNLAGLKDQNLVLQRLLKNQAGDG